jgi:hypothetical protein
MPQFDIFFYFNTILYFLTCFTILYFVMSFILLPKVLNVLKLRKQKIDFLYKMSVLFKLRNSYIDNFFFNKHISHLAATVKRFFFNLNVFTKKH